MPTPPSIPYWLNAGYVSPDTFNYVIVNKVFTDPDTANFTAYFVNPNTSAIYVKVTAADNYGVTFGNSVNGVQVPITGETGFNASWNNYYTNSNSEVYTELALSAVNPYITDYSFIYRVTLPASCYISAGNKSSDYNAVTQFINVFGGTDSFTISNPNSYSVVLKVNSTNGIAALNTVFWANSGTQLTDGSRITIPANGTAIIDITGYTNVEHGNTVSTLELIGVNTRILSNVHTEAVFYKQMHNAQWSDNMNTYAVWNSCYAGNPESIVIERVIDVTNTATYCVTMWTDSYLEVYVDNILWDTATGNSDSVDGKTDIGSCLYLAAGAHTLRFSATNEYTPNTNPAGFGVIVRSLSGTNLAPLSAAIWTTITDPYNVCTADPIQTVSDQYINQDGVGLGGYAFGSKDASAD